MAYEFGHVYTEVTKNNLLRIHIRHKSQISYYAYYLQKISEEIKLESVRQWLCLIIFILLQIGQRMDSKKEIILYSRKGARHDIVDVEVYTFANMTEKISGGSYGNLEWNTSKA